MDLAHWITLLIEGVSAKVAYAGLTTVKDRQTDRQTDDTTRSVTTGTIYVMQAHRHTDKLNSIFCTPTGGNVISCKNIHHVSKSKAESFQIQHSVTD